MGYRKSQKKSSIGKRAEGRDYKDTMLRKGSQVTSLFSGMKRRSESFTGVRQIKWGNYELPSGNIKT